MLDKLNQLEADVLEMLACGENKVLRVIRTQLASCRRKNRDMTGVGFYTEFEIGPDTEPIPGTPSIKIGDVCAIISGLSHGAGFLLHIQDGVIDALECYCYAELWPESVDSYDLYYTKRLADGNSLRVDQRQLDQLRELPGWPQG